MKMQRATDARASLSGAVTGRDSVGLHKLKGNLRDFWSMLSNGSDRHHSR
jgi:hypothetical protein